MFKNLFKKKSAPVAFQFADSQNTACMTCRHVMKDHAPILHVAHEEDDGMWQFLCGADNHETSDAMLVALIEVVTLDPSVNALYEMPVGVCADRETIGAEWQPSKR